MLGVTYTFFLLKACPIQCLLYSVLIVDIKTRLLTIRQLVLGGGQRRDSIGRPRTALLKNLDVRLGLLSQLLDLGAAAADNCASVALVDEEADVDVVSLLVL
jgi:hypothetical protein